MIIDKNHILKLADLAKITISEEEADSYISDINKILNSHKQILSREKQTTQIYGSNEFAPQNY